MIKNLPTLRIEQFITAFEKKVSEAQAKIKELERMEQLYNIIRAQFDGFTGDNKITIEFEPNKVTVCIHLLSTDYSHTFDGHIKIVGKVLLDKKLHTDGIPSTALTQGSPGKTYTWRLPLKDNESRKIEITAIYPEDGLMDVDIVYETKTYSYQYRVWSFVEKVPDSINKA